MQREIGVPYPWQNYKQVPVQDFQHGAMENTTATIFGDFFLVDEHAFNDRNYTYVNAHELAHQWFGNLVTAEGSDHHWLHEGFATYYQWLSERNLYGEDFFDWERYKAAQLVFDASRIDTVPLGNGKAGSSRFYQKGAWVLYMLDQELGHQTFRKVVQHYLRNNMFGVVNTGTFNKSIKEITGKDYTRFFEQWVFKAGEPHFKLDVTADKHHLDLMYIPQSTIQNHSVVQVPFELHFRGDSVETFWVGLSDSVALHNFDTLGVRLKDLKYWVINPNFSVLSTIDAQKPLDMWRAQYEFSTAMLDRYFAIRGMREFELNDKQKTLTSAFENESEFFAIRAEALSQLIDGEHKKSDKYLTQALQSTDVQLQKEAIKLVKDPSENQLEVIAALRHGNSYELRKNAIHKSINTDDPAANTWLQDSIFYTEPGIPGHEVAITALLYRTAFLKERAALEQLEAYTSSGYDFTTRTKAMEALGALQYFDKGLMENYFDALFNLNRTLSRETRSHLKAYYQKEEYRKWFDDYIEWHKADWSDFQKRLVNLTFGLNLN